MLEIEIEKKKKKKRNFKKKKTPVNNHLKIVVQYFRKIISFYF